MVLRTRTLSPDDPRCYVVQTSAGLFLDGVDHFGALDKAHLFNKDDVITAKNRVYRAMVNYVRLDAIHLPDSPYRKFFYED